MKLNIAFRKTNSLKNIFLPLQKGKDSSRVGSKMIYKIQCQNCDSVDIGETTREKAIKTKEHQKNVKNMDLNSKIFQHVYQNSHSMNFNDFYSSFILPIFKKHSYIYHSSISCKDMTKKCSLNNNAIS